jgi:hypothetical protein
VPEVRSGFDTEVDVVLSHVPVAAGSIQGVVRLPGGVLARGATVTVTAGPSSPVVTTTTSDGVYTFTNLRVGGGYALKVEKAGFVTATRTDLRVLDGKTTTADFLLRPGTQTGSIAGKVLNLNLQPVRNATVRVVDGPTIPASVQTDNGGNFRFDALPEGRYTLSASANNVGSREVPNVNVSLQTTTNIVLVLVP